MASGPDKAMTCRYCQTARVWRAWRKGIREEPTFYASSRRTGSNLADAGRTRRAPVCLITGAGNSPTCRRDCGEAVVTCCGVATAMSQGSSRVPPPSSDQQVNTGTVPGLPGSSRPATSVTGWAHRLLTGRGMGRSRRSSPRPGEPVTWRRAAVVPRSPRLQRKRELDAVMPKGCATEWWRPGHRGIEEAGHASPLGIVEPPTAGTMESPVR